MFKEAERASSNVNGKNCLNQLDPTRMKAIKEDTFNPCSTGETIKTAWADCILYASIEKRSKRVDFLLHTFNERSNAERNIYLL